MHADICLKPGICVIASVWRTPGDSVLASRLIACLCSATTAANEKVSLEPKLYVLPCDNNILRPTEARHCRDFFFFSWHGASYILCCRVCSYTTGLCRVFGWGRREDGTPTLLCECHLRVSLCLFCMIQHKCLLAFRSVRKLALRTRQASCRLHTYNIL